MLKSRFANRCKRVSDNCLSDSTETVASLELSAASSDKADADIMESKRALMLGVNLMMF
jgi:hypothetical protein